MRTSRSRAAISIALSLIVIACSSTTGPDTSPAQSTSRSPAAGATAGSSTSPTPSAVAATPVGTLDHDIAATWAATRDMVTPRTYPTATLLPDGTVLVAGGVRVDSEFGPAPVATAELYDPGSGSWSATGSMTEARFHHTATLLANDKVLVLGGTNSVIDGAPSATAELYDPDTGSWTAIGKPSEPRIGHTATLLLDGTVLVAGESSAEVYHPATGSWTGAKGMFEAGASHSATLLPDGRVLVVGGPAMAMAAELYDAKSGRRTVTERMVAARDDPVATLLPDGTVLVAGGRRIDHPEDAHESAEIFDPDTGSWTPTEDMTSARLYHTATRLPDGTVLVAGGYTDRGGEMASAELYDHADGSWTATASMVAPLFNHTATLLPDGTVLVVGDSHGPQASAQIYYPGT